jgi:hypothetical protein
MRAKSEVIMAVTIKSLVFWDVTGCNALQSVEIQQTCHLLSRWFLARLIFRH